MSLRTLLAAVACSGLVVLAAAAQTQEPPSEGSPPAEAPAEVAPAGEQPPPSESAQPAPGLVDPSTIMGSLAIRAVQGTKGGPAVGAVPVEIHLFHQNQPIEVRNTETDEHGVVIVEDLPVGIGLVPVVKIDYATVSYQEVGPQLGPNNREAKMDVVVYETTDEAPDWHISMRHVLVEPRPNGVAVSDMIIVENDADRTWLGGIPDLEGKRTAVTAPLPTGAKNVQLIRGFHGWCCTKQEEGHLAVQMPLMPGQARFEFSYEVPAIGGKTDLRISSPKRVDQMALFIPDDGTAVEESVLNLTGTHEMGQTPVRLYSAQQIPPGVSAGLVLTAATAVGADSVASAATAKQIAAVGIGLVLLVGAVLLILRQIGLIGTGRTSDAQADAAEPNA